MTKTVTGCNDCPFTAMSLGFASGEVEADCNHPETEIYNLEMKDKKVITPSWCPLKKESIEIKLKL